MIDLTWLAGPLGLAGLAAAYLLYRRNHPDPAGQAAGHREQMDAPRILAGMSPIFLVAVVLIAALLWLTVSLPTALAALGGGLAALALTIVGVKALAVSASGATVASQKPVDRSTPGAMLATPIAYGIALASLALLAIGSLYFFLIHRSAAFLQTELVDFGNIVGGLALGASVVALLIAVAGSGLGTRAAPLSAGKRDGGIAGDEDRDEERTGDLIAGVAGIGADLFQSILCASAAAIVIAGTSGIFSVQRVEAVALPILVAAAGLVASALSIAGTRAIRAANPAGSLRTLGIVATALFLILAYLVVVALGLEGRDPFTVRRYLDSGPFWAILVGSLTGLFIAFVTEFFTSWRPMRRLVEGGRGLDGLSVVRALALGLTSAVAPLLLISVTAVAAYYFFGAYGIAMAAVGMLGTVGIAGATSSFRPALPAAAGIAQGAKVEREARVLSLGLASIGGSAAAIGRGTAVACAGMTGIALFTAFSSASGLWAVGIDMQGPLVLSGLMIGTVVPVAVAAIVLSGVRATAGGSAGKDATGLPASASVSNRSVLTVAVPTMLLGVLLPAIVGYTLGVQALAGLVASAVFTGSALAMVLASAGSALVNARLYVQAEAAGGSVAPAGAGIGSVAKILGDSCPTAINAFIKLVAVASIVLVPWFVRIL